MHYNVINGYKCVSLKQYGETMGLSPSRVTQLKSTLPILEFDGINQPFIDLSALELSDEVRQAAEQSLASREQLHTLSNTQLGTFFQALISRLLAQASHSDQLYQEGEELLTQTKIKLDETTLLLGTTEFKLTVAESSNASLSGQVEQYKQQIVDLEKSAVTHHEELKLQNQQLSAENKGLQIALDTLDGILKKNGLKTAKLKEIQEPANTKKSKNEQRIN